MNKDIKKEKKDVEEKERELMFWKHEYEKKIISGNINVNPPSQKRG